MFTYKLLSGGLTRQTPTSSRFACKYAGLEVFVGLRKLRGNEAIRSISLYGYNEREVELYKRKIQKQRTEKEKTWQIRKEKSLIL